MRIARAIWIIIALAILAWLIYLAATELPDEEELRLLRGY